MIAVIGTPGDMHFRFRHGKSADLKVWLADQENNGYEGNWAGALLQTRLVSDKEFRSWRWLDGSRIWKNPEYFRLSGEQEQYDFRTDRGRHPRTAAPDWYNHEPQNEPWTNPLD